MVLNLFVLFVLVAVQVEIHQVKIVLLAVQVVDLVIKTTTL
jgi:hypothetical protein